MEKLLKSRLQQHLQHRLRGYCYQKSICLLILKMILNWKSLPVSYSCPTKERFQTDGVTVRRALIVCPDVSLEPVKRSVYTTKNNRKQTRQRNPRQEVL